jgi:hypothetical protein
LRGRDFDANTSRVLVRRRAAGVSVSQVLVDGGLESRVL